MPSTGSRAAWFWAAGFVVLGGAVAARNLTALATVPPGLYTDEASIGYNAWTIAHYGVDEHGNGLPLFFQAFGEYKNPLYVYALVPLARFLPLTPAVERMPAAIFGGVAILFIALAAWSVTRSRAITLLTVALAALTPWLVQESRVGFEVISMVAALSVALVSLADEGRLGPRRFALAGLFFALAIFAYSVGRLEILLFAGAFALVYARPRFPGWWLTLAVVGVGYVLLGAWALRHPGALTAEFSLRSINADGGPLPTLIGRFLSNYVSYFSGDFLFVHGDLNPRHNTGYAGMLLAVAAPLLVLGLVECWRRRREALPKFVILCLALGPVAASLVSNGGEPHALRSADMLPFWLLLIVFGLGAARSLLRGRTLGAAAALAVAAVAGQGALYLLDMYTAYPVRSAVVFDDGLPAAIATAWRAASGHDVLVSSTFEGSSGYIDADFALLPRPPSKPTPDSPQTAALGITVEDPAQILEAARPGDIVVLAPSDPRIAVSVPVATEYGPENPLPPHEAAGKLVFVVRAV